jgi:hypothetical protein
MADPQTPTTPGEGEFQLGKPSAGLVTLDPTIAEKLSALATKSSGTQVKVPETVGGAEKPPATPTPPPSRPDKAAPTAAAAPSPQPAATPTKPEVGAPTPPPAVAEGAEVTLKGPKALREAYERAQSRVAELETSYTATTKEKADAYTKLAELEGKAKGYEERIQKEFQPALERLTATEKKLQEREEALRIRDYTATTEWHERYVKPITEVQQEAVQFIGELVANVDGREVPATAEHLNFIIGAPNANEAARRAEQLFGAQPAFTGQLVSYRNKLRSLQTKQQEALKNAQLESAEWQKQQQVQQAQHQEKFISMVREKERAYLPETAPVGDDAELKAALAEGTTLADRLANGAPDMTPESWADTVAQSRARIAGYSVLRKQNARLANELAELKKQLTAYQGTEPGVETRNAGTAPEAPSPDTSLTGSATEAMKQQMLAKILKRAR